MRWRTVLFCLLIGGSQVTAVAAARAEFRPSVRSLLTQHLHARISVQFCAVTGTQVTKQEMNDAHRVIRARLHSIFGAKAHERQLGSRCVRIKLPEGAGRLSTARMLMADGSLVIADGGNAPLNSGAYVRVVTRPHRTNLSLKPPVLRVVVAVGSVKQGSANAGFDITGSSTVLFTLTPHASTAWCSFTGSHVSTYAAIVLDNRIISDPLIESAICSGQTQIVGLTSITQAKIVAAYLNYGPLPISFRQA